MKKILSKSYWADQDVEQIIGQLLRYGVIISSLVVLIGGVAYLVQQGHSGIPQYQVFDGESTKYTSFGGIMMSMLALNTKGIIQMGVIVLIATPVLRIAFSLLAFFVEKDRLYMAITFIVLCVMLFSICSGIKG